MKKGFRITLKALGGLLGTIVLLLVVLEAVLSTSVCTSIVNRVAPQLVDGEVAMSDVRMSLFKRFPAITVDIRDMVITYPSERYDSSRMVGVQGYLAQAGADRSGNGRDTLASFSNFSVRLNPFHLIFGRVTVRDAELVKPRIYVHNYADGRTNLETLPILMEDTPDDDSEGPLKVCVNRFVLRDKPVVVYTDQRDSLFALLRMHRLGFEGELNTTALKEGRFDASLDSLIVGGRMGADTLMLAVERLEMNKADEGLMRVYSKAGAFAATPGLGRVRIPIEFNTRMGVTQYDEGGFAVSLKDMSADVATIHFNADCFVSITDSLYLKGNVEIPGADIQKMLDDYIVKYVPSLSKVHTDAVLSVALDFDGCFDWSRGMLPAFNASVDLPRGVITHSDYKVHPYVKLSAKAHGGAGQPVDVTDACLRISAEGTALELDATAQDLLGDDPVYALDACLRASLDSLSSALYTSMGYKTAGDVDIDLKAKVRSSQLNAYRIGSADIDGRALVENVRVMGDSLDFYSDRIALDMALMTPRFAKKSNRRSLGADLKIDSLYLNYAMGMAQVSSKDIRVLGQCSTDEVKVKGGTSYRPIMAKLDIGRLLMRDQDSLRVILRGSSNSFSLHPDRGDLNTTVVSAKSSNKMIAVRSGLNRAFVSGFDLNLKATSAKKNTRVAGSKTGGSKTGAGADSERGRNRNAQRAGSRTRPEWLSEKDFRKSDVRFELDESLLALYKSWNLDGSMKISKVRVATPMFPLKTSVSNIGGTLTNDRITLDTLRLVSGASDVSACGEISNLKAVINGRGITNVRLDIESDTLSLGELFNAYAKGQANMRKDLSALETMDDSEFEQSLDESVADSTVLGGSLLVVPANVNMNVNIHGKSASYSDMVMKNIRGRIVMKQRCMQLSDFATESNIGKFSLDAFYSTITKQNIVTGFDLNMRDVSAHGAISLLPQIDTLLPMLRSFDGNLNCSVAATASLDTNMNIISKSMDGVMRISGKDLRIDENKELSKMARMLMFKEPKNIHIDTMSVEGVLKGENLEIFPFVMNVDRYCLALAGVQRMDMSFNYHVSLIKSPLLVKIGANFYGPDFDNMKFKLGKALYRNPSVPVFSEVIDTTHLNLRTSILNIFERGVDRVVNDNKNRQKEMEEVRRKLGYSESAAVRSLEGLSEEDRQNYESGVSQE